MRSNWYKMKRKIESSSLNNLKTNLNWRIFLKRWFKSKNLSSISINRTSKNKIQTLTLLHILTVQAGHMKITWADLCCRLNRFNRIPKLRIRTSFLTSRCCLRRISTVCSSHHRKWYSKLKVALDYGTYMKRWTSWKPPCTIQMRKYKTLATTWTETSTESNLNWRRWPRRSNTRSFIQLKKLKCWKLTTAE